MPETGLEERDILEEGAGFLQAKVSSRNMQRRASSLMPRQPK